MGLNYTKRARAVCGFTETTLREPGLYMGLDYTKRARTATSTFTQLLCSELYVHRNLRLRDLLGTRAQDGHLGFHTAPVL